MSKLIISASILAADFNHLKQEIKQVEFSGAKWLHFDVMDGHFVDNISFGIPVLKSIAHSHNLVNDVHIMISEPKRYAKRFVEAGAEYLTFHLEACKDLAEAKEIIDIIHQNGAKAGISIKPNTEVGELDEILPYLDLVLIMSVEPGFGGQSFMESALDKIAYLKKARGKGHFGYLIEVDGGINQETAKMCKEKGVDVLVAGSYVFQGDKKKNIDSLK